MPDTQLPVEMQSTTQVTAELSLDSVVEPLRSFTSKLAESNKKTAPVRFPHPEQLTVKLVNVTLLERLEETRADGGIFQSGFWTLAGALLGYIVAIPPMTTPTNGNNWTVLGLITVGALACALLWIRAERRAAAVRKELLQSADSSY